MRIILKGFTLDIPATDCCVEFDSANTWKIGYKKKTLLFLRISRVFYDRPRSYGFFFLFDPLNIMILLSFSYVWHFNWAQVPNVLFPCALRYRKLLYLIAFDDQFGLVTAQHQRLEPRVIGRLELDFGPGQQHVRHGALVVPFGHPFRVVPVLVVHVPTRRPEIINDSGFQCIGFYFFCNA